MLVLALQFSRGDVAHAEPRQVLDAAAPARDVEFPLPQNGREDGDCQRCCSREGPNP